MSVNVSDVLLRAYYRRNQNAIPNDANEQSRGISFVGDAYRELLRQNKYWFTIKTYAFASINGVNHYDLPSDYRDKIELRYNGALITPQSQTTVSNIYRPSSVTSPFSTGEFADKWFYISGDEIIIHPKPSETPSTLTGTATVVGTTATVVTTTEHGYSTNDYAIMSGGADDGLNKTARITVTNETTFTYEVVSGTASGSVSVQKANITLKYYYWPTMSFSSLTDEITIPEQYKDALSAYVFGVFGQMEGERGDAGDGFNEFNTIYQKMNKENFNRRLARSSSTGVGY